MPELDFVNNRLWTHANLNEATHENLDKFLGGISMTCLQHLMFMGKSGYVVDNNEETLVTDDNIQRLKGIPILFIHGDENTVYKPDSTMTSYNTLRQAFGSDDYERVEYPGKGHLDCWMGKASYEDVYPRAEQHARQIIDAFGSKN